MSVSVGQRRMRELSELVREKLIEVLRESPAGVTESEMLSNDNGYGAELVWAAFHQLFIEGWTMVVLTPSGVRFSMRGEDHKADIAEHFGHSYFFNSKEPWRRVQ